MELSNISYIEKMYNNLGNEDYYISTTHLAEILEVNIKEIKRRIKNILIHKKVDNSIKSSLKVKETTLLGKPTKIYYMNEEFVSVLFLENFKNKAKQKFEILNLFYIAKNKIAVNKAKKINYEKIKIDSGEKVLFEEFILATKLGKKNLYEYLRHKKFIRVEQNKNYPLQQRIDRGEFELSLSNPNEKDNHKKIYDIFITSRGMDNIISNLVKDEIHSKQDISNYNKNK